MKCFRAIVCFMLIAALVLPLSGCETEMPDPSGPLETTAPQPTESRVPAETEPGREPTLSTSPEGTQPTSTETTAPADEAGQIDWLMHGTWISADGITEESVYFLVSGKATLGDDADTLTLDIQFPDMISYSYQPQSEFTSLSRQYGDLPYLVCPYFSYDKVTNDTVWSYFALCPENEYMIFWWEETPDRYLVASTDPDTDPRGILTYFQGFIFVYIKNSQ